MNKVTVETFKTSLFQSGQDLVSFIAASIPKDRLHKNMVLAVTSKLVSLSEKRLVAKNNIEKTELIKEQSDIYLGQIGFGSHLTLTKGMMIVSAGIDESNSEKDDYIIYPEDPFLSAQKLHRGLSDLWGFTEWGLILTDSCTRPVRKGVQGICLAFWGFDPISDKVGQTDIFGRPLKMTQVNLADSMAAMAVLLMGEADEMRPLALIEGMDLSFKKVGSVDDVSYSYEKDMYHPLLESFKKSSL